MNFLSIYTNKIPSGYRFFTQSSVLDDCFRWDKYFMLQHIMVSFSLPCVHLLLNQLEVITISE